MSDGATAGFFGKMPSRGDFVRSHLPPGVVETLDGWITRRLDEARRSLGDRFDAIWCQAPSWRFVLRAGVLCEGRAASGIWIPSADQSGRYFPLCLVVLHPPGTMVHKTLGSMEPMLHDAIVNGREPAWVQSQLDGHYAGLQPATAKADPDMWWRHGMQKTRIVIEAALPDDAAFRHMLEADADG